MSEEKKQIGVFERYLTLWVAICIAACIAIGHFTGDSISFLNQLEISNVNIPVAILILLTIYPMMQQIDFPSLKNVGRRSKGVSSR